MKCQTASPRSSRPSACKNPTRARIGIVASAMIVVSRSAKARMQRRKLPAPVALYPAWPSDSRPSGVAAAPAVPGILTRMAGMPAPMRAEQYSVTMKISPVFQFHRQCQRHQDDDRVGGRKSRDAANDQPQEKSLG